MTQNELNYINELLLGSMEERNKYKVSYITLKKKNGFAKYYVLYNKISIEDFLEIDSDIYYNCRHISDFSITIIDKDYTREIYITEL